MRRWPIPAARLPGSRRHEHLGAVHPPAGRDGAADGWASAGRRSPHTRSCRWRRCRRSISRRSRSRPRCPAPARRPWPRPWRSRWNSSSPRSPASAQLTSTSVLGSSPVTMQFDLDRNIDGAAQDIQAAINAAGGQLPKNLPSPPTYRKVNPAEFADHDPGGAVRRAADDRGRRLRRQRCWRSRSVRSPASRRSISAGEQKPAVRVQVDPARSPSLGMSLEDMRAVAATATVNAAKGSIDGADRAFTIYANDQLTAAPPGTTSSWPTATARRSGFATSASAVDGPESTKVAAWQNGKRGVLLTVFKQPGANVIDTVDRIKAALPAADGSDPAGGPCRDHVRPDPDDPGLRPRRAVHAGPDDRPGRDGDLPVPAERLRRR